MFCFREYQPATRLNQQNEKPTSNTLYSPYTRRVPKTVNRQWLFDLKKSQVDTATSDPSIKGPKFDPKLKENW